MATQRILYLDKIPASDRPAYQAKLIKYSGLLKIDPNWFQVVSNSESDLNPAAYNPHGGATGLIQFMPATAKGLGTSTEALRKMTASQQLDYAYKYFKPYAGRFGGPYDLYLVTFFPAAIGKPDNWVFEAKNISRSSVAKYNPTMDLNHDQKITIAEFKEWFVKRIGADILAEIGEKTTPTGSFLAALNSIRNNHAAMLAVKIAGVTVVVGGLGYLFYYITNKTDI